MQITREETAIHEAGHYVASALLMQMPGKASIVPDTEAETLGRVYRLGSYAQMARWTMEAGNTELARLQADSAAFIDAAGGAAVWAVLDRDPRGTEQDETEALDLLEVVYGDAETANDRYWDIFGDAVHMFSDADVKAALDVVIQALLQHDELEDGGDTWEQVGDFLDGKEGVYFAHLLPHFPRPRYVYE